MPSRAEVEKTNEARRKLAAISGIVMPLLPEGTDDPPAGGFPRIPTPGISSTYDDQGRMSSRTVDGVTTTYEYDSSGRVKRLSRPAADGIEAVNYTYDGSGVGSIASTERVDGSPELANGWRAYGQPNSWVLSPAFPSFVLDEDGWIRWRGRIVGGSSGSVAMRLPSRFGLGTSSARTFQLESSGAAVTASMSAYTAGVSNLTLTFMGSRAWVDLSALVYPFGSV